MKQKAVYFVEFALLAIFVIVALVMVSRMPTAQAAFKISVSRTNDGVLFERYCGYLMDVGHGSVMLGDEPMEIAYLFFKDKEGTPSIVKTVYGDTERIRSISKGQYYDIGARKYSEGFSFPRRLEVVSSCN